MASRLELHEELCVLLESRNVYYDPPESVKKLYPAVQYSLSGIDKRNANDKSYTSMKRYQLVVIDRNPDSELPDRIITHFPLCSFDRSYIADNLNHFVLSLYY